jgi:2,4-dienoyl-CoA reductase (NADPH2)
VDLYDSATEIGGQFNLAKQIPGKEEFHETIRYYDNLLERRGVNRRLGERVDASSLAAGGYDEVVLATGVAARTPEIPGIDHQKVKSYADAIENRDIGKSVAIVGAGGIGFDVAELLATDSSPTLDLAEWKREWGVGDSSLTRGGIAEPEAAPAARQVFLLQRKETKIGAGLGKTSGWVHRAAIDAKGVEKITGVHYDKIDDAGLHIRVGDDPKTRILNVDNVVICAGQDPRRELYDDLVAAGVNTHLIGGADVAAELDAKRAIKQGTELAAKL